MKAQRGKNTTSPRITMPRTRNVAAWSQAIADVDDRLLTRPQKLQFQLMLGAAFSRFDPFKVIRDLFKHRSLWRGVIMDRGYTLLEGTHTDLCRLSGDLVQLRDIATGVWNVDTLFVLTEAGTEKAWKPILEGWEASEINLLEGVESGQLLGAFGPIGNLRVMTIWWE